ncbi:PspC domain-containing protein [Paenibacillus sp. GCM10012307]|uniref:PspC domain-containing protein n=1 Tax=Paenibacillus roseus TaxID=2798579 RepID=A0A934MP99_9BACL|nr:PspC domain-containing protein [Paenibacillus roseus]MBJ6360204.1 PspC domain-containing protein [Paenibacillus roseus]
MKKLYRSTRDKKLLGLCGGVAEMLNIDATLLRVLFIVAVIFSSGTLIFVYILAGLVVPKEPPFYNNYDDRGYGGSYNHGPSSYNDQGGYYNPGHGPSSDANWQNVPPRGQSKKSSDLDDMMNDIEKKAMRRELDELRAKLAKLEKEEK